MTKSTEELRRDVHAQLMMLQGSRGVSANKTPTMLPIRDVSKNKITPVNRMSIDENNRY